MIELLNVVEVVLSEKTVEIVKLAQFAYLRFAFIIM